MLSCNITRFLCFTAISPDHSIIHASCVTSMQHGRVKINCAHSCFTCYKLLVCTINPKSSCDVSKYVSLFFSPMRYRNFINLIFWKQFETWFSFPSICQHTDCMAYTNSTYFVPLPCSDTIV